MLFRRPETHGFALVRALPSLMQTATKWGDLELTTPDDQVARVIALVPGPAHDLCFVRDRMYWLAGR